MIEVNDYVRINMDNRNCIGIGRVSRIVNETIYVNVKGRSIFSTKQENKDLLEKNTIAIMFPYIRSYISSITTQPGMAPIVLPAMNIVAMINDQKTEEKS